MACTGRAGFYAVQDEIVGECCLAEELGGLAGGVCDTLQLELDLVPSIMR